MKTKEKSKMNFNELVKKNKLKIIKEIKTKTNIKFVEVSYSGAGDSGAIDQVTFFDSTETVIPHKDIPSIKIKYIETSYSLFSRDDDSVDSTTEKEVCLPEALEDFCWDILSFKRGGWEINDGSEGYLKFDIDKGTLSLNHTEYYTESVEYTDEI
jgi:hypothetical protein